MISFCLKTLSQQRPLIATVKSEKRDGTTTNNPYVAFRRRTEKMQTRKVSTVCDCSVKEGITTDFQTAHWIS